MQKTPPNQQHKNHRKYDNENLQKSEISDLGEELEQVMYEFDLLVTSQWKNTSHS